MQVYILNQGGAYEPMQKNGWKRVDIDVAEAIKKYSGNTTIQFQWEDDGINYCQTIPSPEDVDKLATKLSLSVVKEIKDQLLK